LQSLQKGGAGYPLTAPSGSLVSTALLLCCPWPCTTALSQATPSNPACPGAQLGAVETRGWTNQQP